MTREEIKPVVAAWCDEKMVQFQRPSKEWEDFQGNDPDFFNAVLKWRIKPEPKLRPWKPEEVPVGAVFKHKDDYRESLIIGRDTAGMKIVMTTHGCQPVLGDMMVSDIDPEKYIWRWPQYCEWHPCGVEE